MPGKLQRLSGKEVAALLGRFGFSPVTQKGSHLKLRRAGPQGERQTLLVPLHDDLDRGTLRAILRQASRYIPEEELRPHFYAE
jgi:predicted RNA binding protein YcfA (HicA-like mRNA interferase family)